MPSPWYDAHGWYDVSRHTSDAFEDNSFEAKAKAARGQRRSQGCRDQGKGQIFSMLRPRPEISVLEVSSRFPSLRRTTHAFVGRHPFQKLDEAHGLAGLVLQVLGQSGLADPLHLAPDRLGVFVVARALQSCATRTSHRIPRYEFPVNIRCVGLHHVITVVSTRDLHLGAFLHSSALPKGLRRAWRATDVLAP